MSDNIDIIVQDTINDIVVNSSTIVETIDITVEASVEEITIISNPNDYIININKVIGEQVQSDWDVTIPQDPAYIKNKPTIPDAQVNSDWNATSGVAEILNKPTIPTQVTNTSELINDGADGVHPFITAQDIPAGQVNSDWNATSGVAEILNKPTIPAEQVNSDWNATSGKAQILNKPTIPSISGLATVTYVDTQDALKVDKIAGKGLSTNDFTNTLKTKLDGIQDGAEVNVNADWNATSGDAQILNKPTIPSISGLATITYVDAQDALKVDKVTGKGLSTNDFTNTLKTKLDGIQDGAEVNVNADWNATSGDAQILNKPTIPAAQVNSDWNATSGVTQILNKPTIPAAVTKTSDLINDGADGVNPFITDLDIQELTTADIADSTNKRYVTDANLTTIGNQSGTNTGDETTATIKSKLGITTLSGSNTGDQDLSGLVPNTRTINTKALSSDVTLTTADVADSTNKRYVTDANLTTIENQSGTNTGDNAVNSLYSGLATSKQDTLVSGTNIKTINSTTLLGSGNIAVQPTLVSGTSIKTINSNNLLGSGNIAVQDTLVSGTNIKTINGNSVLGSGNLTISGGGGLPGVHNLIPLSAGDSTNLAINSASQANFAHLIDTLYASPFISAQTFTATSFSIYCTTGQAGAVGRILIYSDLNGLPNTKLYESATLSLLSTGFKTATNTFSFTAGTTYWITFHNSGTSTMASIQTISLTALLQIKIKTPALAPITNYRITAAIGSAPATWTGGTGFNSNIPLVLISV